MNIISRVFFFSFPLLLISYSFLTIGFAFLIVGTGDLLGNVKPYAMIVCVLPVIPFMIYLTSGSQPGALESIGWAAALSPFIITLYQLARLRMKYAAFLDLFIMGWLFLLIVNVAIPMQLMDPAYSEVLALFGKIMIFIGMLNPGFPNLVDDLKRFLISGLVETYPVKVTEHFVLVNPETKARSDEIEWIRRNVTENSKRGVRSILLTMYDLISPDDLESAGILEEEVYLIRVLPSGSGSVKVFEEKVMTMNDNIANLRILISDIIRYANEHRVACNIILYTLSWLIHTHGWRAVFSSLLSEMTTLKNSNVSLYCFYYPETHTDKTEISKFERMSDQIVSI